jgi:hypothetical protein
MIGTSFVDYEGRIREQFSEIFAPAGFDPGRDIAGIILNRWGHAYLNPQPGFFFGVKGRPAPREILRNAPFGRIAFANTDLAGAMDHRYSILEAQHRFRRANRSRRPFHLSSYSGKTAIPAIPPVVSGTEHCRDNVAIHPPESLREMVVAPARHLNASRCDLRSLEPIGDAAG